MKINPRVFRQYDIRGRADRDLDDAVVHALGRALGTHYLRHGARRITLGRDCRLHSPRLHAQLTTGLLSTGIDLVDIGVVPTPVLYFSVFHFGVDGGVQITGSHNPPDDNGFKIMRGRATIFGAELTALRDLVEQEDFVTAEQPGTIESGDALGPYAQMIAGHIRLGDRRFGVVLDAGNGVGALGGVPVCRALGITPTELYSEPDGRFPHHHPDPTVEANLAELKARVAAEGAEVGIAFDGDGDRIGVVDARGRVVWADQLLLLFARAILADQPGATFVSEVKCSQALYDEITRLGGHAVMWKVGHSLIKEKMKEVGAALAGEMSGHMFFADRYYGFDDAIYAAARLLELLSRSPVPLEALVDTLPRVFNSEEIRRPVADEVKHDVGRAATERFLAHGLSINTVDGARVTWPDGVGGGWALVRASNTQAMLALRFEAGSAERLAEIRRFVEGELSDIAIGMGTS